VPSPESHRRFVVVTRGEPLLQVDEKLIRALHDRGFAIAVETNGSIEPPTGIDWICVNPKAGAKIVIHTGQELKLVFPQPGVDPNDFAGLAFENFYLQPLDGLSAAENTAKAVSFCQRNPR
jgi:7-carboxy-7-deazaguanine synthase